MHCILLFHLFIFLYAKSIVHFKNKRTSQKKNIVPLKRTGSGPVEGSTVWFICLLSPGAINLASFPHVFCVAGR